MRVDSAWSQKQAINAMNHGRSALEHTRQQLSSGQRVVEPADDPVAATDSLGIESTVKQTDQYQRNIGQIRGRLHQEEQVLSAVVGLLQKVRTGALQASTASQTNKTRNMIGTAIATRANEIFQLSNTKDGTGDYIFSGYKTDTKPFEKTAAGVVYKGDDGQRIFQIGPTQFIAAGDTGARVFEHVPAGNGHFTVKGLNTNQGQGVIGATSVTDASRYNGGHYTVTFSAPHQYSVTNAQGDVVATGTHQSGGTLRFAGIELNIDGSPAAGDQFVVAPAGHQSIFTTLQKLTTALSKPVQGEASRAQMHNAINDGLRGIDRVLTRLLQVRAQVGARLNNIDDQKSLNDSFNIELKARNGHIKDLDFAAASSRLLSQKAVLQAAQKAFVKVQNLSLFNLLR